MNAKKNQKTAYLFREIGNVDDALLQEAIAYRPQRSAAPRVLLIAACLSLSILLSFGAILIAMRAGSNLPDGSTDKNESPSTNLPVTQTLDQLLLGQMGKDAYTTVTSEEELDYFGGKGYVVWQYADSTELCVSRALSENELDLLTKSIGKGTSVGQSSPAFSCRVWLILGDGSVVTPYLKSSEGNVGSAELFDYDAELIPTNEFTSRLSEILS